MVDLEKITDILVKNAQKFGTMNKIDMSMFSKNKIPEIYNLAATKALEKEDYDAVGTFLYHGNLWNRLLEIGDKFFHSDEKNKKEAGKHFLEILMCHYKLPKDIAVELADDILENDGEHSRYRAVMALRAGKAIDQAEEIGYHFLEEGNFEDGMRFLNLAKKDLSDKEVEKYAKIALEKGRFEDVLKFHQFTTLDMSKDRARTIIKANPNLFDEVFAYMEEMEDSFTPEEIKEFADQFFEAEEYKKALGLYEKAGNLISGDGYIKKGEEIILFTKKIESQRTSWSPGKVWPTLDIAHAYFSKKSPEEAKQRIASYADALLEKDDFARISSNISQFGMLYKMLKMKIPVDKALKAAQLSEKKGRYDEAAEFYVAAGKPEEAKRLGNLALNSENSYQQEYGAKACFKLAGDKEGLALYEFIKKNLRRY